MTMRPLMARMSWRATDESSASGSQAERAYAVEATTWDRFFHSSTFIRWQDSEQINQIVLRARLECDVPLKLRRISNIELNSFGRVRPVTFSFLRRAIE